MRPSAAMLAIASLLLSGSVVVAQTATPSNQTVPTSISDNDTLVLWTGPDVGYQIQFARPDDLASNSTTALESINLEGPLFFTDDSTFANRNVNDFAVISCDGDEYDDGIIDFRDLIDRVISAISPGNNDNGAIILYSLQAERCDFAGPNETEYSYRNVFTMISPSDSRELVDRLTSDSLSASISTRPPGGQSTSDDNDYGPAPTTTIAMVILYVITGLISLLFLIIIISGAVRARRHPERYRNRRVMGLTVDGSTTRGMAAAIVDMFPVIKFGEREPDKQGDIEMQDTNAQTAPAAKDGSGDVTLSETPRPSNNVDPAAAAPKLGDPQQPLAEESLACSICTDDFVKGEDIKVLPCNHKFHPKCIDPWLLNRSGTCPLCRIDLRVPEPSATETTPSAATDTATNANGRDASPGTTGDGSDEGGIRNRVGDRLSRLLHRNRATVSAGASASTSTSTSASVSEGREGSRNDSGSESAAPGTGAAQPAALPAVGDRS